MGQNLLGGSAHCSLHQAQTQQRNAQLGFLDPWFLGGCCIGAGIGSRRGRGQAWGQGTKVCPRQCQGLGISGPGGWPHRPPPRAGPTSAQFLVSAYFCSGRVSWLAASGARPRPGPRTEILSGPGAAATWVLLTWPGPILQTTQHHVALVLSPYSGKI